MKYSNFFNGKRSRESNRLLALSRAVPNEQIADEPRASLSPSPSSPSLIARSDENGRAVVCGPR